MNFTPEDVELLRQDGLLVEAARTIAAGLDELVAAGELSLADLSDLLAGLEDDLDDIDAVLDVDQAQAETRRSFERFLHDVIARKDG